MIDKIREHVVSNAGREKVLKPTAIKYTTQSSHERPGQKIKITKRDMESGKVWKP